MGCCGPRASSAEAARRGAARLFALLLAALLGGGGASGCAPAEEAPGLGGLPPGGGNKPEEDAGAEPDTAAPGDEDVSTGPAAPTVTIEAPEALACVGATLPLTVKADHEYGIALVEVKMGEVVVASATKAAGGLFELPVDLSEQPEGPLSALVVVTAKNGDKAEALGTWTVDHMPPTVELKTPNGGDVVVGDLSLIAVASDEGCGLTSASATLSGGDEDIVAEQPFAEAAPEADLVMSLSSGDQGTFDALLHLEVADAAGNLTTVDRQVFVVQPLRFLQAIATPSNNKPQLGLHSGDWDGDGLDDAILHGAGGVLVMRSNGDTTFEAVKQVVPTSFVAVDLMDVDGDGALDVVGVVKGKTWELQVWTRLADGTAVLSQSVPMQAGIVPTALTLADLTGDDRPEVVLITPSDNKSVVVHLGNDEDKWGDEEGNRTFFTEATKTFGGVANGRAPHAADFDGDGKLDIAVGSKGDSKVAVFLGDGAGGFLAAYDTAVDEDPIALAVGYFSGGAWPDLVVASEKSGRLYVLAGKGNGYFQPTALDVYGGKPNTIVTGHFDEDGKLDFAVSYGGSNAVWIFTGGNIPQVGYVTGANPSSIVAGLYTNDDVLDLLVVTPANGTVTLLPGNGDGTFAAAVVLPMPLECTPTKCTPVKPKVLTIGELNSTPGLDLALADKVSKDISWMYVYESDGSLPVLPANVLLYPSNFQVSTEGEVTLNGTQKGAPVDLETGDFDGDGLRDLAMAYATKFVYQAKLPDQEPVSIDVFFKKSEPGLEYEDPVGFWAGLPVGLQIPEGKTVEEAIPSHKKRSDAAAVVDIEAADMDGDGADDLVVLTKFAANVGDEMYDIPNCAARVAVFRSLKNGKFERISSAAVDATAQTDPGAQRLMLADVNVDGHVDAVVLNNKISDVAVLYGSQGILGDGQLVSVVSANPVTAEVMQVNADEDVFPDVLSVGKDVRVAFGRSHANGEQPFETPFSYSNYPGKKAASIDGGDLNGDGISDIVIADSSAHVVYLYAGIGDRQFARDPVVIPTALAPRWVDVRDMDGDSCPDVATAGDGGVAVLRNLLCD